MVALLPKHRQPQELAWLLEDGHSVAVGYVADVYAIYLIRQYISTVTMWKCLVLLNSNDASSNKNSDNRVM